MGLQIAARYKRWRHGRGFGIHSPFAFDFITRTLRERLPYYAYDRIDALAGRCSNAVALKRRLRLIFRITVRFNPARATIIGDSDAAMQRAVLKAVRRDLAVSANPDNTSFIIVNSDEQSGQFLLGEKAVCIFPDLRQGGAATCELVWSHVTRGMRFDNSRGFTIIVTSQALPRQRFDVRF